MHLQTASVDLPKIHVHVLCVQVHSRAVSSQAVAILLVVLCVTHTMPQKGAAVVYAPVKVAVMPSV